MNTCKAETEAGRDVKETRFGLAKRDIISASFSSTLQYKLTALLAEKVLEKTELKVPIYVGIV